MGRGRSSCEPACGDAVRADGVGWRWRWVWARCDGRDGGRVPSPRALHSHHAEGVSATRRERVSPGHSIRGRGGRLHRASEPRYGRYRMHSGPVGQDTEQGEGDASDPERNRMMSDRPQRELLALAHFMFKERAMILRCTSLVPSPIT